MNNYFTISKPNGLKLNAQKTDFNVNIVNYAKFESKELAQKWIDENNEKFLSIKSKQPAKLSINEHKVK
jgi:hypothetical protein